MVVVVVALLAERAPLQECAPVVADREAQAGLGIVGVLVRLDEPPPESTTWALANVWPRSRNAARIRGAGRAPRRGPASSRPRPRGRCARSRRRARSSPRPCRASPPCRAPGGARASPRGPGESSPQASSNSPSGAKATSGVLERGPIVLVRRRRDRHRRAERPAGAPHRELHPRALVVDVLDPRDRDRAVLRAGERALPHLVLASAAACASPGCPRCRRAPWRRAGVVRPPGSASTRSGRPARELATGHGSGSPSDLTGADHGLRTTPRPARRRSPVTAHAQDQRPSHADKLARRRRTPTPLGWRRAYTPRARARHATRPGRAWGRSGRRPTGRCGTSAPRARPPGTGRRRRRGSWASRRTPRRGSSSDTISRSTTSTPSASSCARTAGCDGHPAHQSSSTRAT